MLAHWKESYDKPSQCIKKQSHHFADKGPYIVKAVVFPIVMYGCESWSTNKTEPQSLCFHIVVQKTPESPLDSKEITAVNPTGNQPRIFPGNTVAEAPIL